MNGSLSSDFSDVGHYFPHNELTLVPILDSQFFIISTYRSNGLHLVIDYLISPTSLIPKVLISNNNHFMITRSKVEVFQPKNLLVTISSHGINLENLKKFSRFLSVNLKEIDVLLINNH